MKSILAIDQSLTQSGFTRCSWDELFAPVYESHVFKPKSYGTRRLSDIRTHILQELNDAEAVLIEDYAFCARGAAVFQLGELGGMIRLLMADLNKPLYIVNVGHVKKWATGAGNAKKPDMMMAAERSKLFGAVSTNDNIIDSLWMANIGYHLLSEVQASNTERRLIIEKLKATAGK